MSFSEVLLHMIDEQDFIPLHDYMMLCASHPEYGYYRRNDPLGRAGDFITAPEISQMFGEMIAIWLIMQWKYFGCPHTLYLCELGAGRGTLMQDILRVAEKTPAFKAAVKVFFLEQNETLKAMQKQRVPEATWLNHLEDIPTDQTLIVIANEFFDALPVAAYRFKKGQWWQAVITLSDEEDEEKSLSTENESQEENEPDLFALQWQGCDEVDVPERFRVGLDYTFEHSPFSEQMIKIIASKIAEAGGCGLFFDYGYSLPPDRLTVRSFSNHTVVECTHKPSQCDITADVDFMALTYAAQEGGCVPMPLLTQREFLTQMGIKQRCKALLGFAKDSEESYRMLEAVAKLVAPEEMGERFKVLCILSPDLVTPWPFNVSMEENVFEDNEEAPQS
jgi:NADH dehydrogenase [ubiquinone] 1 alpha subcomplex assembly factor 7